ncbi:hypothetical protein [Nocardia blacklockiae]|uniref:hypothetical protein n=1 Tax=Nocardia blacklockiae TaxID=480036 RepID=UPI001895CECA|nr:hypothetical protein [Nocardia blacklockiae]MBF6171343.1 hypothetical protein [Nocardia blacklockiae]
MSDWLRMNPDGVRQQADSYAAASQALSGAADSWAAMLAPGDLGSDYQRFAKDIVTGFEHVTQMVRNWSGACASFGDALRHSADNAQYTDAQFAGEVGKVTFDGTGDLTSGGK